MKQWKLLLAALLCVLLVCISVGTLAETVKVLTQTQIVRVDGDSAHHKVVKWYVDKDVATGEQVSEPYGEISWEGHRLSVFVKEVASTCTEAGYSIMECEDCHYQQKYDLPKLAHNLVDVDEVKAICGKDGMQAHKKCTMCGGLFTAAGAPTTADALKIPMPSPEHSFKVASSVAAKCLENGRMHLVCQICFFEKDEIIPKLGHVFDDSNWVIVQAATCENPGVKYRYCINPDCEYYESAEIPALGHNFDTSMLSALRSGCVDGDVYDAYTTVKKASTCTADGIALLQCRNVDTNGNPCPVLKEFTIPAGHVMGAWTEKLYYAGPIRNVCTEPLIYQRDCVKCGGNHEENIIAAAIGHSWIIVTLDEETGEGTRKCANCGAFEAFHITIGPNELVNPENPTEEDPTVITPDPTDRPLDIQPGQGGDPAPVDPDPVNPDDPEPEPEPVPEPVVRPGVYRTQGVVAENPNLADKQAVIAVQNFAKGATYKVNLVSGEGKLLGYIVFSVKKDAVEATYKVLDIAGNEIAVDDSSMALRVYDYLSDAEALNDDYWLWTPSMTLYAIDATANNLQVYLVLDTLSL